MVRVLSSNSGTSLGNSFTDRFGQDEPRDNFRPWYFCTSRRRRLFSSSSSRCAFPSATQNFTPSVSLSAELKRDVDDTSDANPACLRSCLRSSFRSCFSFDFLAASFRARYLGTKISNRTEQQTVKIMPAKTNTYAAGEKGEQY